MADISHLDPEGPDERCPTCGQRVGTFTTDDGTSYYLATAEQEASEAADLRDQLQGAVTSFERVDKLASWIERDRREPDKVIAYAQELAALAAPRGAVVAYECPNGHPVELVQMVACEAEGCMAYVAYEPVAHAMALDRQLQGAVCLTDAERDRVLWWLGQPVVPGPMKALDEAIIRKLTTGGH